MSYVHLCVTIIAGYGSYAMKTMQILNNHEIFSVVLMLFTIFNLESSTHYKCLNITMFYTIDADNF